MSKRSSPYLILFALWLMVFAASSQVIIIAPILPQIGAELGIGEGLQGTLIPAYAFMLCIFALITGPISDRVGRRKVLLYGTIFMAVALFLHGFVQSYTSLMVMRGLAGAAGGMLSGAAVAYVGDYFPYERRGWANGWVMSGIAFGQVFGIPLGKLLADWINFRWPFLMFAFAMAGAYYLILKYVPQPDVLRAHGRLTLRGALTGYRDLLRRRSTVMAVLGYFLMFFSVGVYVVFLPTWLETDLGIRGEEVALLFFIGGLANVVSSPLAGHISDHWGRKPIVVWSCYLLGVIMLLTTFVITEVFTASVFFAVAMITVGMRISPLQSLMTALVVERKRGILMSLAVAVGQVGVGLGSVAAGLTYLAFDYLSNTIVGAISIIAMAFVVQRYLPEPEGDRLPETHEIRETKQRQDGESKMETVEEKASRE